MKPGIRHKFVLLSWCFLSLLVLGASLQEDLNGDYEQDDGGIFDGNVYDDTVGELSVKQKKDYAYQQRKRYEAAQEDDSLSEDEPQEDEDVRRKKDWFLEQLNNMHVITDNEKFDLNLAHDKSKAAPQGETEEDRQALRREEAKQKHEDELKAKKKSALEDEEALPKAGELFEGDIVMSDDLRDHILGKNVGKRDGLSNKHLLWPKSADGTVRIPYTVAPEFANSAYSGTLKQERLDKAIADFKRLSCIRFEKKTDDDVDHVHFMSKKSQCFSSVGRRGGEQKISIGDGCERLGTMEHEMLHAAGFIHEQSRPDRDDYVKVLWKHIKKDLVHNFKKYPSPLVKKLVEYDFDSVMHYHNKAFTSDGAPTLRDIADPDRTFGQRVKMSKNDVVELNRLYECNMPSEDMLDSLPYE